MVDIQTQSQENLKNLKHLLSLGKNVGFFIGAGISKPLGISPWKKLLEDMAIHFKIDLNVENSIENVGYPETASIIYKQLNDRTSYLNYLHEAFEPKDVNCSIIHLEIIDFFKSDRIQNVIITTNFDSSFEIAFKREKINFETQKLPQFNEFKLFTKPNIVYLHGNNDTNTYILRKEEYDPYYPTVIKKSGSPELENFLKTLLTKVNLIFIGFSFDDYYLYRFIETCLKNNIRDIEINSEIFKKTFDNEISYNSVNHFTIISDKDDEKIQRLNELGIRTITYSNDKHAKISDILNGLKFTKKSDDITEAMNI